MIPEATYDSRPRPAVSVIVPTYNRPDLLERALRSILAQTFEEFEVLVVNDAGEPVEGLVASLQDSRIQYIRHERNRGLPAARNTALQMARGRYIAYLDDDDLFYPNHLETLVQAIEQGPEKVVYSDAEMVVQRTENGETITMGKQLAYSYDFSADLLLISNYIPVLCILHERSVLDDSGWFDESLTSHEDWELWIRVSRQHAFRHVPVTTAEFMMSLDPRKQDARRREMFTTLKLIYQRTDALLEGRPDLQQNRRDHVAKYMADIEQSAELVQAMEENRPAPRHLLGVSLESILTRHPGFANRLPTLQGYITRGKVDLVRKIVLRDLPESPERAKLLTALERHGATSESPINS